MAQEPTTDPDERLRRAFLRRYARTGTVGPALEACGATRADLRRWTEGVEGFADAVADAHEDAVDEAEAELRLRAVHGRDSLLFHAGTPIWRRNPATGEVLLDDNFEPIAYTENERSDSLLALYVKAHRPIYRDKSSVEVGGPGGAAVPVALRVEYVLPDGKTMEDCDARITRTETGEDGPAAA